MKAKNKQKIIDIIYPDSMKEGNPQALVLCEIFITKLFQSNVKKLKIKVNNELKLVECNDIGVKNFLDLLAKSNNLGLFYNQFVLLLHKAKVELGNQRSLICYNVRGKIAFEVNEIEPLPDIMLKVRKITG